MSEKVTEGRVGSIVRYDKIRVGMQELFIQVESTILNDNLKFVMETLGIFNYKVDPDEMATKDEFKKSLTKYRREYCESVDASKGVQFDDSQIKADSKISFGMIQIVTIKTSLTFKLEKKSFDFDFSNPRAMYGLLNILYPFISSLASISDAGLKFNELIILEGYYSQAKLIENITEHYIN